MSDEISWCETGGTRLGSTSQVLDLPEGAALILGLPRAADWVRTPPELGSRKLYIQRTWWTSMCCPINNCGAQGSISVIDLEEGLSVICCESCKKYGWVRTSQTKEKWATQTVRETR